MTILAIAGSLRAASSNASLVRALAPLAPEDVQVSVFSGLEHLPLFSPDLDPPPEAVVEFRAQARAASGVVICTPEYAYGMPGALKNALDWLVSSGELYQKPVAALSASPSAEGGAQALAGLRQTLTALGAVVPPEASFAIGLVKQKLDGDMVTDPALQAELRRALAALIQASA